MLYKKNKGKDLDMELFSDPTSEYRGTPFWAWNCKLDKDQAVRQIDYFKEMGFGGFHMHSRSGMGTEYLGAEFMECVRACVDKAKNENMLAWLYDEDRWASGAAGGFVTKEKKFRRKGLCLTQKEMECCLDKAKAFDEGIPYYLGSYDVELDDEGYLVGYNKIEATAEAEHSKWNAYVLVSEGDPWFNNQAYPDTADEESIAKFIDITYNAYKNSIGDEFDRVVPAIFTDEPNFAWNRIHTKSNALDGKDIFLPWSRFFEEKYKEEYNEDIVDLLPELVWITKDRTDIKAKYRYYDFSAECFARSFSDQCGKWCDENGIAFTGHLLHEESLAQQVACVQDNMRHYRSFSIPGIDILCDRVELSTAKQCQSVVHQMGKEAMLSELYGVTNWDYDFRGHKFQGDWQAALGVTVRVPHLSWMSMAGEAKRDYPASIFYQSSWYKKYKYIEDHFARLNTVLTRGKPIVKVGLIHPVESFWTQCGPNDQTGTVRIMLDENFDKVTTWLLDGHHDFNYINESLLPSLASDDCRIGEMMYDAIVIPDCISLRSTTIDFLKRFRNKGGKVIFMGACPYIVDGKHSELAKELFENATRISFNQSDLMAQLEECRQVDLRLRSGYSADKYLYQLRQDETCKWLFVAKFKKETQAIDHGATVRDHRPTPTKMEIVLKGEYTPRLYDTISGKEFAIDFVHRNGKTVVFVALFESDSVLIKYADDVSVAAPKVSEPKILDTYRFEGRVEYELSEPNVLLLDQAYYRLDDGEFQKKEEILRLDNLIRDKVGYPRRKSRWAQPWVYPDTPAEHSVTLKFEIHSEISLNNVCLALEDAEKAKISLNDKIIDNTVIGWFADESIKKIALPTLPGGISVLEITLPFSLRSNLEYCYLLGAFGVRVEGTKTTLTALPQKIGFGSVTEQSMPFYGADITYHLPISIVDPCDVEVHLGKYVGALCEVSLDEGQPIDVAFSPYNALFKDVSEGEHIVKIKLYGNRFNTFGSVHNFADRFYWYGPDAWRTVGDAWGYEYALKKMGMLTSPTVTLYK